MDDWKQSLKKILSEQENNAEVKELKRKRAQEFRDYQLQLFTERTGVSGESAREEMLSVHQESYNRSLISVLGYIPDLEEAIAIIDQVYEEYIWKRNMLSKETLLNM